VHNIFYICGDEKKAKKAQSSSAMNQNKSLLRILKRFNAMKDNFDFGSFII
jgi:hypothetical protein